jgi:hypothetical protein
MGKMAARRWTIHRHRHQRASMLRSKLPMHLSPRCGARTRRGNSCNALKHGLYTAEAIARRREISALMRAMKALARNN